MARRRVRIEVREYTFVTRGWQANELLLEAGIRAVWSGSAAGWTADRSRLSTALAYFDHRHLAYVLDDPDAPGLFPDGGDAA